MSSVGGSAVDALGKKFPDGIVMGTRGNVGLLARALRKTRALDRGLDEASAPSREVLYKWIEESMTQRDMLKTDYEEKDLTANIKRAGLTGIVVHPQLMAKKDDFLKALDTFGVTEFERKATIEK